MRMQLNSGELLHTTPLALTQCRVDLVAMDGDEPQGIMLGTYGINYIVPNIENTTISGLATIATNYGPKYWWSTLPVAS